MSTEETLRERMRVVLKFGVAQRALADRLDVSETWLSRWLRNKADEPVRAISVPEMDRFEDYLREFAAAIGAPESARETQRADAPAGEGFSGGGSQPRKTG